MEAFLEREFAQCLEEADEETVGYYCRAWILHLFGCVLFPDAMGDNASWMWIHCLSNWDQAGQYSWGSAVLCFLYRQLCEGCHRSMANPSLGGCVYLLQLWMWARLLVGHPEVLASREWFQGQPPSRQPMLQVEWEPYDGEGALSFQLSNVCGFDDDFYRMRCPLICFYR